MSEYCHNCGKTISEDTKKLCASCEASGNEPDACECLSWCQNGGRIIGSHHRNCRHYDLEGDCHKIITDLLRGIEASAQDTDGIHPALWEAYKRGKASVWEFDWKESDD